MHLVVTGGNGYIGQHFCRRMHQAGHRIFIIDDFSTSPPRPMHAYGEFFIGDVADPALWDSINTAAGGKLDAVIHFAARAIVSESERQDQTFPYLEENLIKGTKALNLALERGVRHWVQSSTCATFGIAQGNTALRETSPQRPINTYGHSKLLLEQVLKEVARKYPLKVGILRYFNAAGCCPRGELGEHHEPETHLIPNLLRAAQHSTNAPFKLFGDKFPTADGSCVRDYIHVEDLVRAHDLLLHHLCQSTPGCYDYNLGTGTGHSVKELLALTESLVGKKIPLQVMEPRPGDPAVLVASAQKAERELGFKTEYTIRDCVQHTWQYMLKQGKA